MYRMPLSVLRRVCRLRQGERLSQFCTPSAGEAAGRKRRVPFRRLLSGVLALCRRATRNGCAVGCLLVLRKRKTRKRNAGSKGKNEKRSSFKCVPCAPRKGIPKERNGIFAPTMPVNRLLNKKGEMRKETGRAASVIKPRKYADNRVQKNVSTMSRDAETEQ